MLLAVSGGADSLALLRGTLDCSDALGLHVEVATLDHGLRPTAGEEARAVEALARRLGVTCHVRALGLADGAGIEARARHARYAALEELRQAKGLKAIATAHTASDQAETLLMRLMRGASLRGAAGVRETVGRIVRPMLAVTRAEVEAFLTSRGMTALADDVTNRDPRFLRARVRTQVLPTLTRAAGFPVERAFARFARWASQDDALLTELASDARSRLSVSDGSLDAVGLRALDGPILRRVIALELHERGLPADAEALERALRAVRAGSSTPFASGLELRCQSNRVRWVRLPPLGAPRALEPPGARAARSS